MCRAVGSGPGEAARGRPGGWSRPPARTGATAGRSAPEAREASVASAAAPWERGAGRASLFALGNLGCGVVAAVMQVVQPRDEALIAKAMDILAATKRSISLLLAGDENRAPAASAPDSPAPEPPPAPA